MRGSQLVLDFVHRFNYRMFAVVAVVLTACLLAGCAADAPWPRQPAAIWGPPQSPEAVVWQPDRGQRGQYLQVYRDGVKRALYYSAKGDGQFEELADLDQVDVRTVRHVFVMLDGVPFKLVDQLYREGHFRLFYPPARMIAPFPSITDVSYSNMFQIPGKSAYESLIYDPSGNKMYSPTDMYLSGANELWSTRLDYRQRLWLDGVSYILPRYAARREFHAMFGRAQDVLRKCPNQQNVLIYSISTDAAAHVVGWQRACELLVELDGYIERLMYQNKGQIGVVMFADHGNNFQANCGRVPIENVIGKLGLTPIHERGFKKPGEVLVPRYGLISLVQMFCQTDQDRQRIIPALLATKGVEHAMWRAGDAVELAGRDGQARICCRVENTPAGREEFFSYTPAKGDPLQLLPLLAPLSSRRFEGSETPFYSAADLLQATANHTWPDPLWRIWHGLTDQTALVPDLAVSLAPGWYYGSPGLDQWTHLNGTHGGLRDVDTVTFFASTMFAPPPVMRTVDFTPVINQHFDWVPPVDAPSCYRLDDYFKVKDVVGRQHLK